MALGIGSGLPFSNNIKGKYFKALCSLDPEATGIIFVNNFTSSTREDDDIVTYSMDIYLTDPGGFDGTDSVVFRTGFSLGGGNAFNDAHTVDQDTLTSISGTLNIDSSASLFLTDNRFNIANFNFPSDKPGDGSAVFVKNLVTVHKANDGTIKETRVFDFSSSGDISMISGSGRFLPFGPTQAATFTKGNFLP